EAFEGTPLQEAFYRVMEEIAEICKDNKIKYLTIAGDLFDIDKPAYDVVLRTISVFKSLRESGTEVIVVPGNHDNSRRGEGVLNVLAEAGLIHLLSYNEEMEFLISHSRAFDEDRVVFYGIPGFKGGGSREIDYVKRALIRFDNLSKYRDYSAVILAHLSTKFAGYDPSKYYWRYGKLHLEQEELLRRLPSNTTYVALGHIHLPLPLDSSFRGNIAYPGAPIGIDSNDLRETFELSKIGISRRILLVDLDHEPPLIKALRLNSTPRVYYASVEARSTDEVKNYIKMALGELGDAKYGALILRVKGIERIDSEIENYKAEIMRKNNIFISIKTTPHENYESATQYFPVENPINMQDELTLPDIELNVLREVVEKRKLPLSVEKFKWLIDKLSRGTSFTTEKLLEEIVKELVEVING
ncbi:MAG: metallophosphoesterase, partial [Desulfurococcaceae archaeon]